MHCMFVSSHVQLPSVALAVHYGFLGSSSNRQDLDPKIVCALYVIQAVLLCLVFCSYSYSHEEIVLAHQETPGLVVVKPCYRMTVAVLHSYTHVLGWAYFRIVWAYFRVKGGPIFGRGVLENTPIPLFEQILNLSPIGIFSRDYGISIIMYSVRR